MKILKSPLPGSEDYIDTVTNHYYADKTLLIKELFDKCPQTVLFTRPRRFGKSLNLSMIRTFCEKTGKDTSVYFKDKEIWKCGSMYREQQGRYPVISISFHAVLDNTWNECLGNIKIQISEEFKRHSEVAESGALSGPDLAAYNDIVSFKASENCYASSLLLLSRLLEHHYSVPAVVLIDEYDTPLRCGKDCGYYTEVLSFMNEFLVLGLESNQYVKFGVLAGIMTALQTGLSLHGLHESSVLINGNEYFGFTREEVRDMLAYYGYKDKYNELCEWYDGYRFGNAQVLNPWSVLYYIHYKCSPDTYWGDTADNGELREMFKKAPQKIQESIMSMVGGGTEEAELKDDTCHSFCSIKDCLYANLLSTGYLTAARANADSQGSRLSLQMPNEEVKTIFRREIIPAIT